MQLCQKLSTEIRNKQNLGAESAESAACFCKPYTQLNFPNFRVTQVARHHTLFKP